MLLSRANFVVQVPARTCVQQRVLSVPSAPSSCWASRSHASAERARAQVPPTARSHKAGLRRVRCSYSTTYEQYTEQAVYADSSSYKEDSDDEEEDDRCEVHHVHSRLPLTAVALGDNGSYVVSFEDGDAAWSGVSDELHDMLETTLKYKREVASVALGRNQGSDTYCTAEVPEEVYFMRRNTGVTYMGEQCEEELQAAWDAGEGDRFVVNVSFAPINGWFARRQVGATWNGLPDSLDEWLDRYWDKYDGVQQLSVGHNGEWFVLFKDGHYGSNGVHPALYKLLHSKRGKKRTGGVQWVELGPDGTWVALFDKYTAWYGNEDLTEALLSCM